MVRLTLTLSALYLAAVGLGLMLFPHRFGVGAVAANDLWGVASGEARDIARLFLAIHLAFAIAFVLAWKSSRSRLQ